MGELLIKPYEISVWEDELTQNGFIEKKLAVIGSNTMTGLNKVYDPVFNKKANGEKSLTFSLKYKYFDPYTENDEVINPFVALLTNERKVKLHYDNQWYEFIVKEHVESSEEYTWSYTCTDAFVLELSKRGYNITFDAELNNNQGTAEELATETLKDTDWQIGGVDNFKQLVAEPIYKANLVSTSGITIINASNDGAAVPSAGQDIYLFYSYVKNQDGKFVQFIIRDNNRQYVIDDKNVITDTNFRIETELTYNNNNGVISFKKDDTTIITIGEVETKYQANRLAYNQLTTYDPVLQRTVDRFGADEQEIYRYIDYVYTTSNIVMSYITNGDNFNVLEDGTLQGWNPYVDSTDTVNKLELVTRPELGSGMDLADLSTLSQIEGFLKVRFNGALTANYENAVFNSGIENNASSLQSVAKGDKFVFRWRAGRRNPLESDDKINDVDCLIAEDRLRLMVAKYTQDQPTRFGYYYKHIDSDNIILDFKVDENHSIKTLNNIIKGGTLVEGENGKLNYVINDVVQTPSTKYIYVNVEEEIEVEYVWNGEDGTFELKTNDNYLPYYYLIAEANQAITNTSLKDVTEKYGIFVYTIGVDTTTVEGETTINPIYIQDIQLTRYIPTVDEENNEAPIIMGNIPTAVSTKTEYYYVKPAEGAAAEDIILYTSVDELASATGISVNSIVPLYNEGSIKNLTISASKSNCFDILQTIAETFECWIDLVVNHDSNGYITYTNDVPDKYVYLREYAGDNNYAGFKYGINLKSIERTINSDEFVTKLIVDQSQSDLVDEGYVSIALAPSNTSNESYILNFDYYYSQGLLDKDNAEEDRLQFISDVATLNLELQDKEKIRRDLESSMTALGSKRNVYTELIDTAKDMKTDALGDFENLTNRTYSEYQEQQSKATYYDGDLYIKTEDEEVVEDKQYYAYDDIEEEFVIVEEPSGNPKTLGYYEILPDFTQEETIVDIIGELYVTSATINNYSGLLTNVDTEYWNVREQLRGKENYNLKIWTGVDDNEERHVFVELNDYLPGFSFEFAESTYESTVSVKYWDIINANDTTLTFTAPDDFVIIDINSNTISSYEIDNETVGKFKINYIGTEPRGGVELEIKNLQEQKDTLTKNFNNKYSRYIQEGTWSSTDYIDSELYYLDALQVSNTSAQPTVSYTINVVEISELEGFQWYLFDAGDKTYVEDTEFFGWANINNILTPAREEVIVSEVEWHLDKPDENTITVQNYKTRFEDFFQRISATVQTVQYNETTYAKISSLVNPDGTINEDVMLESLANVAGKEYSLTSDGSVMVNQDVILIQNLTNPANRVIINSEGIRVSSDGGNTWTTAIDGQGINIGTVYTGTLNTNEVIIGSRDNPSFRWDKAGISAFKYDDNDSTAPYDLQTYVRFDQYGLYGIKDNESFKAQSLNDVLNNAHFAVTWDGFLIRNSYTDGYVSISSDNDFQVVQNINGVNQEKIKIGALEFDNDGAPTKYGINIKNDNGDVVFTTGDDGDITITGTINAQAGEFSGQVNVGPEDANHIIIDGENAYIKSSLYEQDGASSGWIINANGDAVFNNITARGSIKTAVFEYAEIQAVGGVFIFRPSSTIRSAAIDGNNLVVTVEKPMLFKADQWCKVSNYTADGEADNPDSINILNNNGLAHVYKVSRTQGSNNITLLGAAAMVSGVNAVCSVDDLIGGSLVDMGNKTGTSNYGIGINSSDNTVNLPARAISLFETIVNETREPKVTYNYRGILGTLPPMSSGVNSNVYQYMQGTQGIYTDNMYIGDNNQYIAFYTDNNDNKHLKINTRDIIYEINDGQEITWEDHIDSEVDEATPILVEVSSSVGNMILRTDTTLTLTCTVRKGNTDITNQVSTFTWSKLDRSGNVDPDWSAPNSGNQITIAASDIFAKAIFICEVTL